jgi:hypothetical protein
LEEQPLGDSDHHARVLAAANATVSWIHARRALWDDPQSAMRRAAAESCPPLESIQPTAIATWDRSEAFETAPTTAEAETSVPRETETISRWSLIFNASRSVARAAVEGSGVAVAKSRATVEGLRGAVERFGPPATARAAALAKSLGAPLARSLPIVLAAALLLAAVMAGRAYWLKAMTVKTGIAVLESVPGDAQVTVDGADLGTTPIITTLSAGTHTIQFRSRNATRTTSLAVPAGGRIVERVDWSRKLTGRLQVSSEPTGAQVRADGVVRGVTPLTLDDLTVGVHAIVLESANGSVRRSVTINANETAQVAEVIFSGWLTVFSPFEVIVTDGTRAIRLDERNQIMLTPGPHALRLENRTLGYQEVHRVDIRPGETTSLSVVPPRSTLSVTSNEPAEVWLDGVRVGRTPLAELAADLGTREVVLKSETGAERRLTVTMTVKPVQVSVDFSKPAF